MLGYRTTVSKMHKSFTRVQSSFRQQVYNNSDGRGRPKWPAACDSVQPLQACRVCSLRTAVQAQVSLTFRFRLQLYRPGVHQRFPI